jgi:hypothetical protein
MPILSIENSSFALPPELAAQEIDRSVLKRTPVFSCEEESAVATEYPKKWDPIHRVIQKSVNADETSSRFSNRDVYKPYQTLVIPYEKIHLRAMGYVILFFEAIANRLDEKDRMRDFLTANVQMLEWELGRLHKNTMVHLYDRFQDSLNQYYSHGPLTLEVVSRISYNLANLERKLTAEYIRIVEARQFFENHHQRLCTQIQQGKIEGLIVSDFLGTEVFTIEAKTDDTLRECTLLRNFYISYKDNLLEPHFRYFERFLSEVRQLKSLCQGWKKV